MENNKVIINLPSKYLEDIALIIKSFPIHTSVEEYILECVRCGLEADADTIIDYCEPILDHISKT